MKCFSKPTMALRKMFPSYPYNLLNSKTISILKFLTTNQKRRLCSISSTQYIHSSPPDPSLVNAPNAPIDFNTSSAVVYNTFITSLEADLIANDIKNRMKRRRYEKGHWDSAITFYKEIELADNSYQEEDDIPKIFGRARQHLAQHHLPNYYENQESVNWLPCHAIDLKKDGGLNAHVDSVRFSGELVAGLSLLSPSIMRLIPCDNDNDDNKSNNKDANSAKEEQAYVDLFLPPRSLYVLTGVGRYKYSHQLLPDSSIFRNCDGTEIIVRRDRRLSVIFRDAKPPS